MTLSHRDLANLILKVLADEHVKDPYASSIDVAILCKAADMKQSSKVELAIDLLEQEQLIDSYRTSDGRYDSIGITTKGKLYLEEIEEKSITKKPIGVREIANMLFEDICEQLADDLPGTELKMPDLFNSEKYIDFGNKVHDAISFLEEQGYIECQNTSDGFAYYAELTMKGKLEWEEINMKNYKNQIKSGNDLIDTSKLKLAPRRKYIINEQNGWVIDGKKYNKGQVMNFTEDEYKGYKDQIKLLDLEKYKYDTLQEIEKLDYVEQKIGRLQHIRGMFNLHFKNDIGDNSFRDWIDEVIEGFNRFIENNQTADKTEIKTDQKSDFRSSICLSVKEIEAYLSSVKSEKLDILKELYEKYNVIYTNYTDTDLEALIVEQGLKEKYPRVKYDPWTDFEHSHISHSEFQSFLRDLEPVYFFISKEYHILKRETEEKSNSMDLNENDNTTTAKNRLVWKGSIADIKELFRLLESNGLIESVVYPNAVIRDCFVKPDGKSFDQEIVRKTNIKGKSRNYDKVKDIVIQIKEKKGK